MDPFRECSDAELVAACRENKAEAWDELVTRYERLVYTIPLRYGLTTAEAEDVFQTVWVTLLEKLPTLQEPDRVAAWLVTTARRATWDRRRGAEHVRTESYDPADMPEGEADTSPEELVLQYQQYRATQAALARLGERCRRLLHFLYQDRRQPSYADIAGMMDMTVGSIGPTRARCLEKLRSLMGDWE